MFLVIDSQGDLRCIYAEALDLTALGDLTIRRASAVEPDDRGQWWADLASVSGPMLGPFGFRSEALRAEHTWLEENWLLACGKEVEHG